MMSWRLVLAVLTLLALPSCVAGADPLADAKGLAPMTRARTFGATASDQGGQTTLGDPLPDNAPTHLAITLRSPNEDGLGTLLRDQQDPSTRDYHAWLTPEQYGDRFGVSAATYAHVVGWLAAEGFEVASYPNRLFVEATGTVRQARNLLGVQLRTATRNGGPFAATRRPLRSRTTSRLSWRRSVASTRVPTFAIE